MLNEVTLIGHLGQKPESKTFPNGSICVRVSLATTKKWKDKDGTPQEQTQWHNCLIWGASATNADRLLHKGMLIFVRGEIQYRVVQHEGKDTRIYTDINVLEWKVMDWKGHAPTKADNRFPQDEAPAPMRAPLPADALPVDAPPEGDDGLPF
jgi:single-strand DNA-binding protein